MNYSVARSLQKLIPVGRGNLFDFDLGIFQIHDLPLELLDMILGKVYGLSGVFGIRIGQPTDEEVIRNLASVDYCWFQRVIRRRRFKNIIWRKLRGKQSWPSKLGGCINVLECFVHHCLFIC